MLHLYMTRWERYYINIDLLFWSKLDASFALWNLKTANSLNGSVLIAEHQCGTYLFGGRGSGQMWQMSQAHWLEDKHRQKQLGEISVVCVQHEMSFFFSTSNRALCTGRKKVADTVSIVPSQWVLYAANFLNMMQLATCHWSHQLHICMKHSHSPTKLNKTKQKNPHILSINTVPFHLF